MAQALVYLNGRFLPRSEATFDVEDRGMMFGDGVYEVLRYYGGRALAAAEHLHRLQQSMSQIDLPHPAEIVNLPRISDELVERNGLKDARVYWQVTRGSAPREHAMPPQPLPTVLVMAHAADPLPLPTGDPKAVSAILLDDIRWRRCCIKSLMLLPNAMGKTRAREAGAAEAILHRDGIVTEGCSTNVFIVHDGKLLTHPADRDILNGITRQMVMQMAGKLSVPVIERTFTVDELLGADEVMITGTTTHVAGVVCIDSQPIGSGTIGPMTRRLHEAVIEHVAACCLSSASLQYPRK